MNSVLTVHALYSYRRGVFIVISTAINPAHDTIDSAQLCILVMFSHYSVHNFAADCRTFDSDNVFSCANSHLFSSL